MNTYLCINNMYVHISYKVFLMLSIRYRLESAIDFENNNNDIISMQNKCYSNIVYSVRRHTEAIQLVYTSRIIFINNNK